MVICLFILCNMYICILKIVVIFSWETSQGAGLTGVKEIP